MYKASIVLLLLLNPATVFAYLGPGMGGGVLVAIIGFFAALFLGLFGILYYPIKRALKNRKKAKMSSNDSEPLQEAESTEDIENAKVNNSEKNGLE